MKDEEVRCIHSDWKIIDEREHQDYVCVRDGCWVTGYHLCYCDEHCRHYEPIKEKAYDEIYNLHPDTEKGAKDR